MQHPSPRRRVQPTGRAPWPFWWAIIAVGLAGFLFVLRAGPGPGSPAAPVPTRAVVAAETLPAAPQPQAAPTHVETPTVMLSPTLSPTPIPPMPTPITAPRSSRYSPLPLAPDPELAAQVVSLLSGLPGRFGVAIKDLDTGRGVLIDPESTYPAASLFKLPVMYEVFKQRELGVLSFDETLVFTQRHVDYDLGTLDRPAGSPIQLREALERMIVISDNSSAVLLTDRVGALNINRDLAGLGLERTQVLADALTTSPSDMLTFLEMLARGEGVSPQASREMLELMARQQINDRIPRLLPPGTTVAHKTGNLPGVVHDVGVVSGPDVHFAIAVLVADTSAEGQAAVAIAEIAAAAYRHFRATRPTSTPTPAPTETPLPTPTTTPTEVPTSPTPPPPTAAPPPVARSPSPTPPAGRNR